MQKEKALDYVNIVESNFVGRFACNTRVIVDASSSPPVSRIEIAVTKT